MAKTDSKPVSFRLKTDTAFMLEDLVERWKCSQTAAVERAILEAHESPFSAEPSKDWTQGRNTIERTNMLIESHANPAEASGPPKNAYCVHCEQKFAGPKGADICSPCGRSGHVSSGDCRRCVQLARAKQLASSSTGVDAPEVDYDWQEPV